MPLALALAAALAAATALGSGPAAPAGPMQAPAQALADAPAHSATALRRYPAPQARQGVAVGAQFLYAVSNHEIVKYDKHSGERLGQWRGDPQRFPHINSCALIGAELVCACSNYPATPQWSSVEFFDPDTLDHLRSVSLGLGTGSLTWVDRKDGAWWALFANYDGRGGEAPRDHRHTLLVRLDEAWRRTESWAFPTSVLERIAPSSISGGGWGPDGRLYATGHDRPELYVLALPREGGAVLDHLDTLGIAVEGQAIDWDESQPGVLYGISRGQHQIVSMQVPVGTP